MKPKCGCCARGLMMPRIKDATENERERIEGCEGCLGNALVLIHLTLERLDIAMRYGTHTALLTPAVADLHAATRLIRRAQRLSAASAEDKAVVKKFS
jgi:hypothetical protein